MPQNVLKNIIKSKIGTTFSREHNIANENAFHKYWMFMVKYFNEFFVLKKTTLSFYVTLS